jgi:hypothetical protein
MQVKGTGLISTRTFVKDKHASQYSAWLNALPADINRAFSEVIQTSQWYDVEKFYYQPLKVVSQIMYQGDDKKAAFAAGQFSADYGLKGVYKVFLMIATPQSLMKAAKRIIALYYQPVSVELDEIQKKSLVLSTTKLQKNSDLLDYRTIGWCVRALELANCKNVQHEKVEAKYPDMFSVKLSWD